MENLVAFLDSSTSFSFNNPSQVEDKLSQAQILTNLLSRRSWSVTYKTDDQGSQLITTCSCQVMLSGS